MKRILIILTTILLFSCNKKKEEFKSIEDEKTSLDTIVHNGKKLMETHCYLCHNPEVNENEGRIAPPMIAIKSRYLMDYDSKDVFVKNISAFVRNPSKEHAKMRGAVKKFGIMPKQVFPDNTVAQIADFMFDYQIEEPVWFKEHWEGHGNENWMQPGRKVVVVEKQKNYEDIGLEYALSTKKLLGQNLMQTIQEKGVIEALDFCNIQALPLTDKMSTKFSVSIKRVSDKNRNLSNHANAEELKHIAYFKKLMSANQEIKPIVIEEGNRVQFYYPIQTNTMCLQCHGKQIDKEVSQRILKLYPNDLAVGYNENEVRGIWSITFNK